MVVTMSRRSVSNGNVFVSYVGAAAFVVFLLVTTTVGASPADRTTTNRIRRQGQQQQQAAAPRRFLQGDVVGGTTTATNSSTTTGDDGDGTAADTCPPCPQCHAPIGSDAAGGFVVGDEGEEFATVEDPLTLQILVVDSPGIITMGKFCSLFFVGTRGNHGQEKDDEGKETDREREKVWIFISDDFFYCRGRFFFIRFVSSIIRRLMILHSTLEW